MSKARRRVLLIDDEEDMVKVVGKRLARGSWHAVAGTGGQAICVSVDSGLNRKAIGSSEEQISDQGVASRCGERF